MSGCGDSCSDGSCKSDNKDRLPPGILAEYDINTSTVIGTLIWAETVKTDDGMILHPAVPELIGKIRLFSEDRIFAVIMGDITIRPIYDELFSYGIDTLFHIRNKDMEKYHPEAYAEAVVDVSKRMEPSSILIAGTPKGREVAPLIAAMLETGLTADCTQLYMNEKNLVMIRPAFGGNILATIVCNKYPQMATVRPGTFPKPVPEKRKGTAISRPFTPKMLKTIVSEKSGAEGTNISDADILISLGNGIKDRRTVETAEEVAKKIGAKVSCSRALVEKGWMDHSRQVGQSGRNVSPRIYIAFGISGSIQHRAGIHAEKIIAVNNDPNAPIHNIADESIIGDATDILEKLNEIL